jgi:hypothetical protein
VHSQPDAAKRGRSKNTSTAIMTVSQSTVENEVWSMDVAGVLEALSAVVDHPPLNLIGQRLRPCNLFEIFISSKRDWQCAQ